MVNPHTVTRNFESAICEYTGAPYCVCVDNASNALYMSLIYVGIEGKEITIPSNTYPSVPGEIKNAGGIVRFDRNHPANRELTSTEKNLLNDYFIKENIDCDIKTVKMLTGEYNLSPTIVWDSALCFTANMFRPGQLQCLSFTGQWKHMKTTKGGAVLTDSPEAFEWFIRFSFSGRRYKSYFADTFDFKHIGRNIYMPHTLASIGVQNIQGFYNFGNVKKDIKDLTLPYPDLSLDKHTAFK